MKSLFTLVITLSISVLYTGCASAPTNQEIQNANYGRAVNASDCISVAKNFVANLMKDPNSAQFSDVKCYQGWEGNVPIAGVTTTYGYRFEGRVNAKNLFGAYVGYTPFTGIVRDDGLGARVVRYCLVDTADEYGLCLPRMVP